MIKRLIFDVEVYPNLFTAVFYDPSIMDYIVFEISSRKNDAAALIELMDADDHEFVGYNCLNYDGQIIQYIKEKGKKVRNDGIYQLSKTIIDSDERAPYPPYSFTSSYIDLFKIWHYDRPERYTSLKWLEFTLRQLNIVDLPYHHDSPVLESNFNKVIKYNKNDVAVTYEFYELSKAAITMREELSIQYEEPRLMNMSDSSLGSTIFLQILSKELGIDERKLAEMRSYRKEIKFEDIILPYVKFDTPEFNNVLDHFRSKVIYATPSGEMKLKGVFNFSQQFGGIQYDFGIGGVHACVEAGVYIPGEDELLVDIDVQSFYPNLGIRNMLKPEHLPDKFCEIYEELFEKRKTYPKSNPLNYAYKILLNSAYGKSNSKYSFLYDPKYTCAITVNGQLSICMLAEIISPLGKIIQANTDGVTIAIKKENRKKLYEACLEWERITKLKLEYASYAKMIIRDVNNYIALTLDGKPKCKGVFVTYDQMTKSGEWHKNHSSTIVADALYNYFINDIPPSTTIAKADNIFDFLYCIKKKRNFVYTLMNADDKGRVSVETLSDRVFRYYISYGGKTMYKVYDSLKFEGVNVGSLVSDAMSLKTNNILHYPDLDKEHYLEEVMKIIKSIE